PHHQLAGTSTTFLRQIVNEAQHQLAGFLMARQIVNVLRRHGLPPDCLLGKETRSRRCSKRGSVTLRFLLCLLLLRHNTTPCVGCASRPSRVAPDYARRGESSGPGPLDAASPGGSKVRLAEPLGV